MSPQRGSTQLDKEELKITPITPEASTGTANNTIDNSTAEGGTKEVTKENSTVKVRKVTISKTAIVTLGEELEKALSQLTLQDDPLDKEVDRPSKLLKAYLLKNEEEFVRVMGFRDRARLSLTTSFNSMKLTWSRVGTSTEKEAMLSSKSSVREPTTRTTKERINFSL